MAFCQNIQRLTWDASPLRTIEIVVPWADQITLTGEPDSKIITTTYEAKGEYQNRVQLHQRLENQRLSLTEKESPLFTSLNDKLSVHKHIATKLHIRVPEWLTTTLHAEDASVHIEGMYRSITVQLNDGVIHFSGIAKSGHIKTRTASVVVSNPENQIKGYSKNGRVQVQTSINKTNQLTIQSISGDIIYQ